ncbi:PLP-dependent cysteine synthase family protein [Corynebacterium pacaense]|uniref:PLP-dependent cysteine synthase family protein n=1 Tax=Corynebacterium pacaense TaxID=1816684 RepID=UPI0009BAF3CF|nr:cysteine synthase family protein [Corynebacterium pacaense]
MSTPVSEATGSTTVAHPPVEGPVFNRQAAADTASRPPTPIAGDITELIGNTPLLDLDRLGSAHGSLARILGKVEFFNPLSSIKDRIAWTIIRDAEERGLLTPGTLIVDITSGNTGIALAAIAASRGYPTKFYLGDNTSPDKRRLLEVLGAEVIDVPNSTFLDPEGLEILVTEILREHPDAFVANQLSNPVNPQIHFETTGPEIWRDTGGEVDFLVAGVGTGGTVSGAGRYLKEANPDLQVVVVEPGDASLPTEDNIYPAEIDGVHKVLDLEEGQLPPNYDTTIADEVIAVEAVEAYGFSRAVLRAEGLLVGPSAGAILAAATTLARRPGNAGKTIVAILPDTGERYLNAGVFS